MAIDFYFDFASPYGFIAAMQIEAIERAVRWRPFLLGAVYKTFGQSPLDHPLKRKYVIEVDAPRMARQIGRELKIPANFPEHSLPPSRAFYWIEQRDPAKAVAFAKAVYCRYWLEGSATSNAAVAADAAASQNGSPSTRKNGDPNTPLRMASSFARIKRDFVGASCMPANTASRSQPMLLRSHRPERINRSMWTELLPSQCHTGLSKCIYDLIAPAMQTRPCVADRHAID